MSRFPLSQNSRILIIVSSAGAIAAAVIFFVAPPEPVVPRASAVRGTFEQTIPPAAKLPRKENPARSSSGVPVDETAQRRKSMETLLATGKFEDRQKALTRELRELIEADPLAASALAESQKAGATRDEMVARVARIWAEEDSARAWQWAARLPDTDERRRALGEVALQAADEQPRRAAEMAVDAGLEQVLEPVVQRWAAIDLAEARDWVLSQPRGTGRSRLTQGLAMAVAETAPDEAARLVSAELPPGPAQEEAAMAVLHRWAQEDPAEARRWVEAFSPGPLRARALGELDGNSAKEGASP